MILIDGPPGSGKSTLGHELVSLLPGYRLLLEMDRDHPLHPAPVEGYGADFESMRDQDVSEVAEIMLGKWRALVTASEQALILESYPYQSHLRVLWQMNAPSAVIDGWLSELHQILEPRPPLLVMLQVTDDPDRVRRVFDMRGQEWTEYITEFVCNTAYGVAHGHRGQDGAEALLAEYQAELTAWNQGWPFRRIDFEAWSSSPAAHAQEIVQLLARG